MSDLNISMNGEMSVLAFSEYTGVSRSTIYRMIDSGKLVANDNGSLKVIDALKFKTRPLMQNNNALFTLESLVSISNKEHQLSHGHALNMNEILATVVELFRLYMNNSEATLPDVKRYVVSELFDIIQMILDRGYTFDMGPYEEFVFKRDSEYKYFLHLKPLFKSYESYLLKHYDENNETYLQIKDVLENHFKRDDGLIFICLFKALKFYYPYINKDNKILDREYNKSCEIMLDMLENHIKGSNQVNMLRLNMKLYDLIELTLCIHLDGVRVK